MNNLQNNNYYPQNYLASNQYPNTVPSSYPQMMNYAPLKYNYQTNNEQQGLIWVQGENSAKNYQTPPGHVVPLFDTESQTIYLKYLDAQGKPCMRILDYVDRDEKTVDGTEEKEDKCDYITKDQFDQLLNKFNQFTNEISNQINTFETNLQKQFNDFKSRTNNSNNKKVRS